MMNATKGKKLLNLAASVIISALIILVWHFALPGFTEITPTVKLTSYIIVLLGMIWVLDAMFAFYTASKKNTPEQKALAIQSARVFVGLIAFAIYSAMSHAVVAVLFVGGDRTLMFKTSAIEKCALAATGFCIFLSNSLSILTKRTWVGVANVAVFILGILLSFVTPNLVLVTAIMSVLTVLIAYKDIVDAQKKTGVLLNAFTVRQAIYLFVLCVVMVVRYFTPVLMKNAVIQFLVSGAINIAITIVIDCILLIILKAMEKKKKDRDAASRARRTNNREKELASNVK